MDQSGYNTAAQVEDSNMKSKMRVSAYHLTLESNPSSPTHRKKQNPNSNQPSEVTTPKYRPLDKKESDQIRSNGNHSQLASKMMGSQMSSTMRNKSSTPYADLVSQKHI